MSKRSSINGVFGLLAAVVAAFVLFSVLSAPVAAQESEAVAPDRSATGGAMTREDIMARQRGEEVERPNREGGTAADRATEMLGTLGATSDSLMWEDLRFGTADVTTQVRSPAATVLVQDRGMWWLEFRDGPLRTYGGYLLLGTIGLLVLFYLIRGKIRIDGGPDGTKILRFTSVERFAHWLLAGSFILLGITGLLLLFGRVAVIPAFEYFGSDAGHEINAVIAEFSKWIPNNVSWAFLLALVLVFVHWVIHNIPNRTDLVWFAKGGGILTKAHPPAKKFNAGQKLIFWSVIVLGGSISASGLSLLFPFELPMFAPTFEKLNAFGVPALLGMEPFPTTLAPHEEMQFAQLWHAIVSFVLMAIIIAHIYIGSVGMEGAFDAMGTGEVDLKWAKDHHSLWVKEMEERGAVADTKAPQPAE